MTFDLAVNETVIIPQDEYQTAIAVAAPLFTIESINTAEARIQSATTGTGNEHVIEKIAIESLTGTRISQGELAIVTMTTSNGQEMIAPLIVMQLKGQLP